MIKYNEPITTLSELKARNAAQGHYYFSPGTVKFWGSHAGRINKPFPAVIIHRDGTEETITAVQYIEKRSKGIFGTHRPSEQRVYFNAVTGLELIGKEVRRVKK